MNRNLSAAVDLLTIEIERVPDRRLERARELVLASALGPSMNPSGGSTPLVAQRAVFVRLRAFLHAVAIRFWSRVGLTVRGSGS